MRELKILLAGLLIVGTAAGCGFRERRWGWCAVGGGLAGAAVGAGTAGGLVNAYEKGRTQEETGAAAGAGAVGGAILGTLLGHAICDPMEEAPPPPPPPAVAAPPPPPAKGTKIATVGAANFDFDKATIK